MTTDITLSPHVILVDAEYVDSVAFDLSVNFERMLERRIPKVDLAHWLDCVALDGGIQPGENQIQAIFLHEKKGEKHAFLDNFMPSDLQNDIDGKAFKDNIGEFTMEAYAVAKDMTNKADFFLETMQVILNFEQVENVMLIPNMEEYGAAVISELRKNKKNVTLLAMSPQMGIGFQQQILGYSLMSAMGIRGAEVNEKLKVKSEK
ncbi:MAG: hypothetical protein IJ910_00320 [Bacteroidaceae bacterium]|nr:hypothetical protein [Bacteroidaceae bacterium]